MTKSITYIVVSGGVVTTGDAIDQSEYTGGLIQIGEDGLNDNAMKKGETEYYAKSGSIRGDETAKTTYAYNMLQDTVQTINYFYGAIVDPDEIPGRWDAIGWRPGLLDEELDTGESLVHCHRTIHVRGDPPTLRKLAKETLQVDLETVRKAVIAK